MTATVAVELDQLSSLFVLVERTGIACVPLAWRSLCWLGLFVGAIWLDSFCGTHVGRMDPCSNHPHLCLCGGLGQQLKRASGWLRAGATGVRGRFRGEGGRFTWS